MKDFFAHFALLLIFASLLGLLHSWQFGASLLIGGLFMMLNLAILSFTWWMISRKKLIALNVIIIVSKYTFLTVALYMTLKLPWIQPLALVTGVTLFVISTVITALIHQKKMMKRI